MFSTKRKFLFILLTQCEPSRFYSKMAHIETALAQSDFQPFT
ncbi:hypothetical protein PRABACTJOHN_03244 [Parabacteroides johnsonii DSM 18315]|uniref:Uncharacterized protein n=1 Tax=Parabacteroides johnsonii DSM 18315 TaxID=537006 RepID=B7BDW9_9BACT|nr:hypothetical protein PRABACTJOHN_03244 [Parabacteroides johnsonii DSM 18315]